MLFGGGNRTLPALAHVAKHTAADARQPRARAVSTPEFQRWMGGLDAERRAKVTGAVARISRFGPTLGRPHVDVIHGSRLHKLKEVRVDRGTRVLFGFDSNRNAVMLVGGD